MESRIPRQYLGNELLSSVKVGEHLSTSSQDDRAGQSVPVSAGISNPPKRAAKGGANSASCLMPTVHSFLFVENLYKSDQEEHLEVSCSLACSAALAIFLRPAGQQLGAGGVLSRVADLFCSLCITSGVFHAFPFHTVTLAPFPSTVPSPCLT